MENQILMAIIPIVSVVVGWVLSSLSQQWNRKRIMDHEKWKEKQQRINMFLENRLKTYSTGLEFVYQVEMNQTDARALEQILEKWKKWYPLNVVYLPPAVNDSIFNALSKTNLIRIDLTKNRSNKETHSIFKEQLLAAKKALMNLKDVSWLPDDLS